jgi:hypothetical protein
MYAHLKIERIKPHVEIKYLALVRALGGRDYLNVYKNRYWVAKINGLDKKYGLAREFIRPEEDYSKSNSKGTRGVYLNYFLEYGSLYEVSSPESWTSTDRYFLEITDDGEKKRLEKEMVIARFKDASGD